MTKKQQQHMEAPFGDAIRSAMAAFVANEAAEMNAAPPVVAKKRGRAEKNGTAVTTKPNKTKKKAKLPTPPPSPKSPSSPASVSEGEEEEEALFFIDRSADHDRVVLEDEEDDDDEEDDVALAPPVGGAAHKAPRPATLLPEEGCSAMAHLGEHTWTNVGYKLTGAYFVGREKLRMARHHIDSANHFYKYQVPDTIRMFNAHRVDPDTGVEEPPLPHRMVSSQKDKNYDTNDYNLSICYDIGNLRYIMPQMVEPSGEIKPMWPSDAHERSRTYSARTKVDIHVTVRHRYDAVTNCADVNAFRTERYTIPDVDFVQMPVLVNSCLCMQGVQRGVQIQAAYDAALADALARGLPSPEIHAQRSANAAPLADSDQDCGGYFIIKGSARVIISQEHGTENRVNVFPHKRNLFRGWAASIASVPDDRCVSPKSLEIGLLAKGNVYGYPLHLSLPASRMKKGATMSLFLLFRALGVMRDRDICEIIIGGPVEQADPSLLAQLRSSMYDADLILQRFEIHHEEEEEEEVVAAAAEDIEDNTKKRRRKETSATKKVAKLTPPSSPGLVSAEEEEEHHAAELAAKDAARAERARAARMNDALLRERCVAYVQSTLSIFDLRQRISALPTRGGGMLGPKLPKVERYTPEQALAHSSYAREDHVAAMNAVVPARVGRGGGHQIGVDTPLLAGPPAELVEYVQEATYVQRQAVFRHCEARRNVHNEIHKYFRQHLTTAHTTTAGELVTNTVEQIPLPHAGGAVLLCTATTATLPWYKFMLNILAVRRGHQLRSRQTDWHRSQTLRVLENDLLPHCKNQQKTVFMLGLMANRLLRVMRGELPASDRDSYLAKRVEPTGVRLNNLFRHLYLRFQKELDDQIKCAIEASGSWKLPRYIFTSENAHQLFNPSLIETGMVNALNSGDFSTTRDGGNKTGVAQVLNRLNHLSTLSHVRRVNTPIAGKNGEVVPPRWLHMSTYGFLCPVETPEGRPVGLVKQLSLLTVVSLPQLNSMVLYETAEGLASALEIGQPASYVGVRLLINGTWVGVATDPSHCIAELRDCKLRSKFSPFTSIVFDHLLGEIRVCTDAGRLCRPMLRVNPATGRVFLEQKHLDGLRDGLLQWDDLMLRRDGFMDEPLIEYLDVEEQAFALIVGYDRQVDLQQDVGSKKRRRANIPKSLKRTNGVGLPSYCEIHPATILGVIAGTTPFPHFNQSPRNTYQAAMAKQAIGLPIGLKHRIDKTVLNMNFPTVPLVSTEVSRILQCNKWPTGCMVRVAIASYLGFNQEDSIILNQASVDRGLFLCTVYKTEKDQDRGGREEAERCNPMADPALAAVTRGIKMNSDYSNLNDADGFNPKGSHLVNRQILMGKRVQVRRDKAGATSVTGLPTEHTPGDFLYEDKSRVVKLTEDAYVHKNSLSRDGDGYVAARCTYRITRTMDIGDKAASRSAQKATVGLKACAEDMPFTAEGTTVDAILNPHAITSRMTVGHLAESNYGKVLSELGLFGDCSAFCEVTPATIAKELRRCGYSSTGTEVFYNGHTGKPFTAEIFCGQVYYQRLKHMVNDKCHSRTLGPTVPQTRQPTDGRSRDGGLRLGEMERDCVISHGATEFLVERMLTSSDNFTLPVCRRCGANAIVNAGDKHRNFAKEGDKVFQCPTCDNETDFAYVNMPFSANLYFNELQAAAVSTRVL